MLATDIQVAKGNTPLKHLTYEKGDHSKIEQNIKVLSKVFQHIDTLYGRESINNSIANVYIS